MATSGEMIGIAIGGGIVPAVIGVPVVWAAMRKQYRLRDAPGLWTPFLYCWAIFSGLQLFGITGSSDSAVGILIGIALPVFVCALVLYATYRLAEPIAPTVND